MISLDIEDTDLTTKARIRNSALELFAQEGEQRVSLRRIAARAEVAVGLIQHHFGTRDGLRAAVDQLVIDCFIDAIGSATRTGTPVEIAAARDDAVQHMLLANPLVVNYIRREIFDPAGGTRLLARLTELTVGQVRQSRRAGLASTERSESAQVVRVMIRQLGNLLLQPTIDSIWAQLEPDARSAKPAPRVIVADPPPFERVEIAPAVRPIPKVRLARSFKKI